MNPILEFEVKARAFHRMTGFLAPGKDCRLHDPEVRRAAWDVWWKAYGPVVNELIAALDELDPPPSEVRE